MPPYKIPKRVKHRKEFRRVRDRKATKGNYVAFGDYGIQALEGCWLKSNCIEAGRIAAQQYLKRQGKLFIRVFPDKPVSKKPLETRMGKGKGEPDHWVAVIRPGTVLFELAGVQHEAARDCFARVAYKLPVRVKLIGRRPRV